MSIDTKVGRLALFSDTSGGVRWIMAGCGCDPFVQHCEVCDGRRAVVEAERKAAEDAAHRAVCAPYLAVVAERDALAAQLAALPHGPGRSPGQTMADLTALVAHLRDGRSDALVERAETAEKQLADAKANTERLRTALREQGRLFERIDEALATPERIERDRQTVGGFVSGLNLTETAEQIVRRALAQLADARAATAAAIASERARCLALVLDRYDEGSTGVMVRNLAEDIETGRVIARGDTK